MNQVCVAPCECAVNVLLYRSSVSHTKESTDKYVIKMTIILLFHFLPVYSILLCVLLYCCFLR